MCLATWWQINNRGGFVSPNSVHFFALCLANSSSLRLCCFWRISDPRGQIFSSRLIKHCCMYNRCFIKSYKHAKISITLSEVSCNDTQNSKQNRTLFTLLVSKTDDACFARNNRVSDRCSEILLLLTKSRFLLRSLKFSVLCSETLWGANMSQFLFCYCTT